MKNNWQRKTQHQRYFDVRVLRRTSINYRPVSSSHRLLQKCTSKAGINGLRIGPRFSKFCWSWSGPKFHFLLVLVRPGPRFQILLVRFGPKTSTEPLVPEPTGYGPWIPDQRWPSKIYESLIMNNFKTRWKNFITLNPNKMHVIHTLYTYIHVWSFWSSKI